MSFVGSLESNFLAIGQIVVLGVIGFYILRRGILGECCLRTISNLVIDVALPCFMFTNITANFDAVRGESWYALPVYCVAMFGLAVAAAVTVARLDGGMKEKREFVSLVTFQNAGFLPIIIVGTLFPKAEAARLFIYIFLFLLFYNPILFALSEGIFSGRAKFRADWSTLFNAASLSTVAGLALALTGMARFVPDVIIKPLRMVGDTTIPLSIIVIGGIVTVNFSKKAKLRFGYILKVGALKLVALPLAVFAIAAAVHMPAELKFLLVLEAMMPPGASLPLLASRHGGDYTLVGQALFGTTMLSLVTVPVLVAAMRLAP